MTLSHLFVVLVLMTNSPDDGASGGGATRQPIETATAAGILKGTLDRADAATAQAPVVLFIPGSGPTDRDGNSPAGVKAAPYRLLAEALAREGIATVRTDKRGLFASAAVTEDHTLDNYVADTRAWIAAARKTTGAPCVWLLGHSEGGLVALATAAKDERDICGLALVATPGRMLGTVIREQLRANPANAPLVEEAERALAALEQGGSVDVATLSPPLAPLFNASAQPLLRSELTVDPAVLARRTSVPMLIVQGEQDLQVAVKDAKQLQAARMDSELALLPGVNHVLKIVDGDSAAANVAAYANPDLPIAPSVAEAVTRFILKKPVGK